MSCPIATALLHNVSFIKRKDCQMYLNTHTQFPLYFCSSHVLSHCYCIIALCFVHKEKRLSNVHTYTHTISLIFSFKPCLVPQLLHCCIMFSSERKKNCQMYLHTHTTLISQIFLFKQKLKKFPYKKL